MRRVGFLCVLGLLVTHGFAEAGPAEDKLGEVYTSADPAGKLVLLSVARSDRTLTTAESSQAINELGP